MLIDSFWNFVTLYRPMIGILKRILSFSSKRDVVTLKLFKVGPLTKRRWLVALFSFLVSVLQIKYQSHDLDNDIINRHYFTRSINGTNCNFMLCVEVEILERVQGASWILVPSWFWSIREARVLAPVAEVTFQKC